MARKKQQTKKEKAEEMLRYTSRDLGQEYIMKRKMIRAIILATLTTIGLAVFIALYMDESRRVQESYRKQYTKSMEAFGFDIDTYMNADGDLEFHYRMLLSDIASANSFIFLLEDETEERQKTINELYTVVLKYPKQTAENMEEIRAAVDDILANLDKGYEEMDAFIDSIDLKGE